MKYVEHSPITRSEAERLLSSGDAASVGVTLLRLALHDHDWHFVQARCVEQLNHPDVWVRRNCATAFGHLARLHGELDLPVAEHALAQLEGDPDVASWVEAARDDIEIFIHRRRRVSDFGDDAL